MSDSINLRKNAASLEASPEFDAYSAIEVVLAKQGTTNKTKTVGSDIGRKLTIEMQQCSDTDQAAAAATDILQRLRGFQYRPYNASSCLLDPAYEIGDTIDINGVHSGIYNRTINFTPLLTTDLTAPQDEAIDHEYAIKEPSNKVINREMGSAYSRMLINTEAITAEVSRAESAESELSSMIEQTADQISAKVDAESTNGSGSESFGWTLKATEWSLKSGNSTVFVANKDGISVTGEVKATSGTIGGFTIGSSAIYNNISAFNGTQTSGVYVGTDGIRLGQNFKVDSSGNITANNANLTGTLNVGGSYITAESLKQGADRGNRVGGGMSGNGTKSSRFECSYFNVTGQLVANAIFTPEIQSDAAKAFIYFKGSSSEIESAILGAKTVKYGKTSSGSYINKLVGRATVTIDGTEYTFATAASA